MKVKLSPALSYFPWGSWSREKKRYGTESGPQTESKSTSLQLLAALQPMDQVSAIGQTKPQLLVLFISFPHMTNPCQTQMTPCTNPCKAITGPTSILHSKLFPDHWSETSTRRSNALPASESWGVRKAATKETWVLLPCPVIHSTDRHHSTGLMGILCL